MANIFTNQLHSIRYKLNYKSDSKCLATMCRWANDSIAGSDVFFICLNNLIGVLRHYLYFDFEIFVILCWNTNMFFYIFFVCV